MRLRYKSIIIVLAWLITNSHAACVNPQISMRDFKAIGVVKNTEGEVVYEEHHNHKADLDGGESKVEYKTPDGEVIAEKIVDYDCRVSAPNYVLQMRQGSNWIETVRWESGQLVVSKPDGAKSLAVVSVDDLVIDAGFDNYVFENWSELISGQPKEIDFLHVPGKHLIKLVINLVADSRANQYASSNNVVVFQIATKSKLLRLFAEPIYLGYDKTTKLLDFYAGSTNLRGAVAGLDKSRQIVINYRYN